MGRGWGGWRDKLDGVCLRRAIILSVIEYISAGYDLGIVHHRIRKLAFNCSFVRRPQQTEKERIRRVRKSSSMSSKRCNGTSGNGVTLLYELYARSICSYHR